MDFRLTYRGALVSNGGPKDKHRIRQQIHSQLVQLWNIHPALTQVRQQGVALLPGYFNRSDPSQGVKTIEEYIDHFPNVSGFRFLPIVASTIGLECSLDILFLRREASRQVMERGKPAENRSDIDNRLKTLFDGLRIPKDGFELPNITPQPGEDPLYCLLQDHSLVTELKVTADWLLTPAAEDESRNSDVLLIIGVRVKAVRPLPLNLIFQ
jgi:hypothetical protein